MRIFAGIGSRETPLFVFDQIKAISERFNKLGYILRSGGADGSDLMWEQCMDKKEIFLPWKGFNGNTSQLYLDNISENAMIKAFHVAELFHPNWSRLSDGAKKLMARNSLQIFGADMRKPADFVVCYTTDGKESGGTGQAMRIAKAYHLPIFNLYHEGMAEKIIKSMDKKL